MTNQKINANYYHNLALPKPQKGQLITRQSQVEAYKYGRFTSDYCGCSWIAQYNAQIFLSEPHPPSVIIRWMENHSLLQGLFLGGLLGAYPWTVGNYFKKQGYKVSYKVGKRSIQEAGADCKAGILFYLRKNLTGHYVTFVPRKKDQLLFINQEQGQGDYEASFQELWEREPVLLPLGLFIKGRD